MPLRPYYVSTDAPTPVLRHTGCPCPPSTGRGPIRPDSVSTRCPEQYWYGRMPVLKTVPGMSTKPLLRQYSGTVGSALTYEMAIHGTSR
eukprot:2881023-Rhodomonas_salina.1